MTPKQRAWLDRQCDEVFKKLSFPLTDELAEFKLKEYERIYRETKLNSEAKAYLIKKMDHIDFQDRMVRIYGQN